ncbi:MAG: hypothetical protein IKF78_04250 [Atopobiaceae bacterium]|nr:hypothetical protein [Atopobiaceae bacterium]
MDNLRIVFLDIDGVMQDGYRVSQQVRNLGQLQAEVARRANDPTHLNLGTDDIAAVLLDWRQEAVDAVRTICERAGARVVIHSSWRLYSDDDYMRALLRIRGLDPWYLGNVPKVPWDKESAISTWLWAMGRDVEGFAVIDDQCLNGFGKHLVMPKSTLAMSDVPSIVSALGLPADGPWLGG